MANPGDAFERLVREVVGRRLGLELGSGRFDPDAATGHPFDVLSADRTVVGECKADEWRENGGVPNGKLEGADADVRDLRRLPAGRLGFLAFARATHPARDETLADYYRRTRAGQLGPVALIEVDRASGAIRVLRQGDPPFPMS